MRCFLTRKVSGLATPQLETVDVESSRSVLSGLCHDLIHFTRLGRATRAQINLGRKARWKMSRVCDNCALVKKSSGHFLCINTSQRISCIREGGHTTNQYRDSCSHEHEVYFCACGFFIHSYHSLSSIWPLLLGIIHRASVSRYVPVLEHFFDIKHRRSTHD